MTLAGIMITTLGAIAAAILTYLGVRFTSRSARAATADRSADEWNAAYRATAEQHLHWDFQIRGRVERLQRELGIEDPIPQPPPLFPQRPKE